ncbi:tat (twin-arginine translocation) pathway signal sequence [Pseudomonas laurentiana]
MVAEQLSRRRFLQGSGSLLLGTLIFTSGPIAMLAPSNTWALDLTNFTSEVASQLLSVIKRIYPHDRMEDAVYAFAIKAVDERASADPSTKDVVVQGLEDLNRRSGKAWNSMDEQEQLAALTAIQDSAFFSLVRSISVNSLYSNELAYLHFGYEGASFPKGGYLMRGFNDLKWLPAAPADASPAAFS